MRDSELDLQKGISIYGSGFNDGFWTGVAVTLMTVALIGGAIWLWT